jgi:hypothetical protein
MVWRSPTNTQESERTKIRFRLLEEQKKNSISHGINSSKEERWNSTLQVAQMTESGNGGEVPTRNPRTGSMKMFEQESEGGDPRIHEQLRATI